MTRNPEAPPVPGNAPWSVLHPVDNIHQDRTADWFDLTSFQEWSRDQHNYMLKQRKQQIATGRIIPQTNEEYGYEDHYPLWAQGLGSESADTLRRTPWDIVMAGGYIRPRGSADNTQTMFLGYAHMVDFFTGFESWKTEPHDELGVNGNYCLAEPGEIYAVYLPHAGKVTVRIDPGRYEAHWFKATSGEKITLPPVEATPWTSPEAPDRYDWALLLQRATPAMRAVPGPGRP